MSIFLSYIAKDYKLSGLEVPVIVAQFLCGFVFHLKASENIRSGLDMMKFTVNHEYKLKQSAFAFICGLL